MVRASTLLAPSQELAARAQPMSRPFSFLLFFSFDFVFASKTFHAFSAILVPGRGGNPQCANGSKHEARSEYELEIEHASFQNRHNILLSLSGPPIVARLPKATRRTIGHGQNTSRMPRLRPFWSVTADVLLRQRPGEEDEEEDEGDGKEDDDKDDGYSE